MLRALVIATAVLGLAACGGDRPRTSGTPCTVTRTCGSNSPVLPGPTLNPNPADPSDPSDPAVVDFAHPSGSFDFGTSKFGCAGYTQCYIDCFNTNPSATSASCQSTCAAQSKSTAQSSFDSALSCGQSYCIGSGSGYKCKLSGSSIVNMDGTAISASDPTTGTTGTKDCGQCLTDALAKLFGDACVTSGVDCSNNFSGGVVTSCGSTTNACLSDLP